MPLLWTDTLSDSDLDDLAHLLLAIIASPASIGFLADTDFATARSYWQSLDLRHKKLAIVRDDSGHIVATVQLNLATAGNSRHRGEIAKLMVHPRCQGQGLATTLLNAAVTSARAAGLSLLVLDTLSDSPAARLYAHLGWQAAGSIPNYASMPNGELAATTYYYLDIA
ncbi:GNAT family N-acetyltransferase [Vitreoscilla massiliensis]|uniref:GNAT family N-acetyltransferase n=1 Tax=Vitreoscilla massiliensis TaxID=1689272 RepID=A0ABY4DZP3_9NEIS|nr:GNAT family N-acetyltransferase [Vitreoscilla massiliensis]UOO88990.1 GNAT family N-acetyltransferase [Vitreoscilla massiliensis]